MSNFLHAFLTTLLFLPAAKLQEVGILRQYFSFYGKQTGVFCLLFSLSKKVTNKNTN